MKCRDTPLAGVRLAIHKAWEAYRVTARVTPTFLHPTFYATIGSTATATSSRRGRKHGMGLAFTSAIMMLIHTLHGTPVGADLSRPPPIHRPSQRSSTPLEGKP